MFVPNRVRLYGSQTVWLNREPIKESVKDREKDTKYNRQKLTISKSRLKALDQPSEHCSTDNKNPKAGACIAKFIEEKLGCWTPIYGNVSKALTVKVCNNSTQLQRLVDISRTFTAADANTIYEETGCLAQCEKDEYKVEFRDGVLKSSPGHTKITFMLEDGSYQEMEQYVLYDFDSFIADVGGFLGLLLGCSVFSLYNDLASMIGRMRERFISR